MRVPGPVRLVTQPANRRIHRSNRVLTACFMAETLGNDASMRIRATSGQQLRLFRGLMLDYAPCLQQLEQLLPRHLRQLTPYRGVDLLGDDLAHQAHKRYGIRVSLAHEIAHTASLGESCVDHLPNVAGNHIADVSPAAAIGWLRRAWREGQLCCRLLV
jgi:hypothetical protein